MEDEMANTSERRLIGAAREAASIAKGEEPAPRVWMNGHAYVPEATLRSLLARLDAAEALAEAVRDHQLPIIRGASSTYSPLSAALAAWDAAKAKGPAVSREALPSDS